jgi:hypothetical protein
VDLPADPLAVRRRLVGREFFWIEFVSCQLVRRIVR